MLAAVWATAHADIQAAIRSAPRRDFWVVLEFLVGPFTAEAHLSEPYEEMLQCKVRVAFKPRFGGEARLADSVSF